MHASWLIRSPPGIGRRPSRSRSRHPSAALVRSARHSRQRSTRDLGSRGCLLTEIECCLPKTSAQRQVEVVLVQVDADVLASVALRDHARGSGATERVEDRSARFAASEDAALGELGWHDREMSLAEWLGADGPDIARVAAARVGCVMVVALLAVLARTGDPVSVASAAADFRAIPAEGMAHRVGVDQR